jgi:hypothetical protein
MTCSLTLNHNECLLLKQHAAAKMERAWISTTKGQQGEPRIWQMLKHENL